MHEGLGIVTKSMHLLEQNYEGLTPKQRQAIELIAAGKTDTQVGAVVGVGRDTVNRWRHHHRVFRKALETHKALLVVYTRVGRSECAFQVFKILKTHLPPTVFPLVISFLKLENLSTREELDVLDKLFEQRGNY